jgi:hypothetical protein
MTDKKNEYQVISDKSNYISERDYGNMDRSKENIEVKRGTPKPIKRNQVDIIDEEDSKVTKG